MSLRFNGWAPSSIRGARTAPLLQMRGLAVTCAVVLAACSDAMAPAPASPKPDAPIQDLIVPIRPTVQISPPGGVFVVGWKRQLRADYPAGCPVPSLALTWQTSNAAVAAVAPDGSLIAKGEGTVTITAVSAYPCKSAAATFVIVGTQGLLDGSTGHKCAITALGKAHCWGNNGQGQVGATVWDPVVPAPRPVAGGIEFAMISTGSQHTCGLSTAGEVYCWGAGAQGRLGNGATAGRYATPQRVNRPDVRFKSVSAGDAHTCALDWQDRAYCWGLDSNDAFFFGSLNLPNDQTYPYPVAVVSTHRFRSIVAGDRRTCGVALDRTLYCWGIVGWYQGSTGVAHLDTRIYSNTPLDPWWRVPLPYPARQVDVGGSHWCALLEVPAPDAYHLYCWGRNGYGQLGLGMTRPSETAEFGVVPAANAFSLGYQTTPEGITLPGLVVKVTPPPAVPYSTTAIAAVSAAGNSTCWLVGSATTGETRCVGSAAVASGPTGMPYRVAETAAAISAGSATCSLSLQPIAAYRCWGYPAGGMLGNGTSSGGFSLPVTVLNY